MLAAPSRQRGVRGDGAHGSPHFTSLGHGEDEERRRFAREITAWLGSRDCGRVSVFAPPRMLGLLRRHVKPPVVDARLRAGELTKLTEHELAAHPAVREVFGV